MRFEDLYKKVKWAKNDYSPLSSLNAKDEDTFADTVTRVLKLARKYVSLGWVQKSMAEDVLGHQVDPTSDKAARFCALGAIERSATLTPTPAGASFSSGDVRVVASDALRAAVLHRGIISWNDKEGRTKVEVLAGFDKAVASGVYSVDVKVTKADQLKGEARSACECAVSIAVLRSLRRRFRRWKDVRVATAQDTIVAFRGDEKLFEVPTPKDVAVFIDNFDNGYLNQAPVSFQIEFPIPEAQS